MRVEAMKPVDLGATSSKDLVEHFTEIVVAQDRALLGGETTKFNRLFRQMMDVANELKGREGDQRRLLLQLFDFPNMQVRLQAAKLTPTGMLWISWPKKSSGVVTDLNENIVRDIGLANGLVDVKVCAVDDVWSALKFVFRLKDRPVLGSR